MNKDKVYLKGYVIGRAADTLGYQGLMVQLENLDVVEIDKNLVHKDINEPQKVTVPQFVADWIKKCKTFEHLISLPFALNPISWEENRLSDECIDWLKSTSNQETFARAWLDEYRIEKEKRYRVNVKNIRTRQGTLNRSKKSGVFIFSNPEENNLYGTKFTRKELEEAGFGGVFNSPLFEVEEVE